MPKRKRKRNIKPTEPKIELPDPEPTPTIQATEAEFRAAIDRLNAPSMDGVKKVDEAAAGYGWLVLWSAVLLGAVWLVAHFVQK